MPSLFAPDFALRQTQILSIAVGIVTQSSNHHAHASYLVIIQLNRDLIFTVLEIAEGVATAV